MYLHNALVGRFESLPAPPRIPTSAEISWLSATSAELAGVICVARSLPTTSLDLPGPFGAFVSCLGNPASRKRRFLVRRDAGSKFVQLLSRKAQHLVLTGTILPVQVGEASNAHAVGEPTLDRRSDEIRREKC